MYCFAKVDEKKFNIQNDEKMVLDLLSSEKILLVHGRAFNLTKARTSVSIFTAQRCIGACAAPFDNFFRTYKQGVTCLIKVTFAHWRA